MAVVKSGGKEAKTRYRLLRVLRESAVFELELDTGRTHQIRVHLAALGAPILGDPVYGPTQIPHPLVGAVKKIQRQALHACQLRFVHPRTGEEHAFSSSLPEDICQLITALTPREEGER
jgi:23S rRNA pseudouridine1911/1915/1917 synthase